ncbi:MAG: damage-control phosphatase ARMT1 family protein [Candidatus Helarchaeota archaeon]
MKMNIDCVICFQRQALRALGETADTKLKERVLRSVMSLLLNEDWTKTPPKLAAKVYKLVNSISGLKDPYKELKRTSNELVLQMYNRLKKECLESSDPILYALKLAVAGNIMDIGAADSFDIEKTIEKVMTAEFAFDSSQKLKNNLKMAKSILYFADNSGEVVFDKLLIELILSKFPNIKKITFVVKAGPIINDATMEDIDQISLRSFSQVVFKTIGNELYPSSPSRDSEEVKQWIYGHDIIISKGQGNYEELNIYKDLNKVYYLLMAKCPVIARDLGIKTQSFVIYS